MSNQSDITMLELLASKICHDLISPIGAVNNGVEFMQDMGPGAGPEAAELIAFSAQQASAKLQAFRLAYGGGGADPIIKLADVHKTIQLIVGSEKKITQEWDPQKALGPVAEQRGFCKILTCVFLLGLEALPKGGKLSVTAEGAAAWVRAEGRDAGLRAPAQQALKMDISPEKLEPQDVHPYMTSLIAAHYGFKVSTEASNDGAAEFRITAA